MLVIPGRRCHTCEGPTRRELLRSGSIGLFGLNLANFLAMQKVAHAAKYEGARGATGLMRRGCEPTNTV